MVYEARVKLSKYKRRRLISSLMSSYPEKCDNGEGFRLKSNSDGFSQRLNSIFDGLKGFEQKHDDWCKNQESDTAVNKFTEETVLSDGESSTESVFKRPVAVAPRKRKYLDATVLGFRKHPEKWIKYSLSDVSESDMSDFSNKNIARNFVEEMRRRRASVEAIDEGQSESIKFRSPVQKTEDLRSEKETSSAAFQNGKYMMPECIVGKKNQISKLKSLKGDRNNHIVPNGNVVQLHHLDCTEVDELSEEVSSKHTREFPPVFKKPHCRGETKSDNLRKDEEMMCEDISI